MMRKSQASELHINTITELVAYLKSKKS